MLQTSMWRRHPLTPFFFSSFSSSGQAPFMAEYLVSSCGLSAKEAQKLSPAFAHLKSPAKPIAAVRALTDHGLDLSAVRSMVLKVPRVLLAGAARTLHPKISALRSAGFSSAEISVVLSANPNIVFFRDVPRRAEFWLRLLGGGPNLLKTLRRDPRLLCYSLDNRISPALALLRDLGVPEAMVPPLIVRRPSLIAGKPERIRSVFDRVASLGIAPGSRKFVEALASVDNLSRSTFEAKMELLRSLGWTEEEILAAIHRFPVLLRYSEKKINAAMELLVKEAGCDPSYVARHPTLVGFSVEKRILPRIAVLKRLRSEGIASGDNCLLSAILASEEAFVERFIDRYGEAIPDLLELYRDLLGKNKD
ncbi:transcription termination factor MTERF15, mitochondrial-like isoform X1 [Wolffia australiana]